MPTRRLRLLAEGRRLARESGDHTAHAGLSLMRSHLELAWGNRDAALVDGLEAFVDYDADGMEARTAATLTHLALLAVERTPQGAARLLGAAEAIEDVVGAPAFDNHSLESLVETLTAALGTTELDAARAEGRRPPARASCRGRVR